MTEKWRWSGINSFILPFSESESESDSEFNLWIAAGEEIKIMRKAHRPQRELQQISFRRSKQSEVPGALQQVDEATG